MESGILSILHIPGAIDRMQDEDENEDPKVSELAFDSCGMATCNSIRISHLPRP